MKKYLYKCIHLPTGQTFDRKSGSYFSLKEFYSMITHWNNSNPTVWLYAPTGDMTHSPSIEG